MGKSKIDTMKQRHILSANKPRGLGMKLNHSSTLGKKENHAFIFFEKNNSISTARSDYQHLVPLESNRGWWNCEK